MSSMLHEDVHQAATEGRLHGMRQDEVLYHARPYGGTPNFIRVVVREVIYDPQKLTDDYIAYLRHKMNVSNIQFAKALPRNTIIGQKLIGDEGSSSPPMFFLPWLPPHLAVPCKPGEHVWVFLDSPDHKLSEIGWWAWKVTGFDHTDDVNHTHGPRDFDREFFKGNSTKEVADDNEDPVYDFLNGSGDTTENGERYTLADTRSIQGDYDAYEQILTKSKASKLTSYEAVPRYRKRPGDLVFEGSNNQLIAFSTDRNGPVAVDGGVVEDEDKGAEPEQDPRDIIGPGTGLLDFVVGRGQTDETLGIRVENSLERQELGKSEGERVPLEGDPDFKNDRTRVLIASKTMVDRKFGLEDFNSLHLKGEDDLSKVKDKGSDEDEFTSENAGDAAAVIKSDKVRLIARSDLVIYVTSYKRDDKGNMVEKGTIDEWACFAVKANGDIIVRPGAKGLLLLGGEDADKGIFVSDVPCTADRASGKVTGVGPISTMGGQMVTGVQGQGKWADRILVK